MDVTQLSGWNVTDCSEVARQDVRPLIDRVITTARDSIPAGVPPYLAAPARSDTTVAPVPGNRVTLDQKKELDQLQEQARGGDAASARRAAELHELLDDMNTAATWWRLAAKLGDPDAEDYVREILGQ
ncbi:hypothetical protein [Amycolatopsis orientalis]|uniref:hypothetical protein n=1 Tax=Amycolatopsis orientalis TaxID=31958 RepID=UPI0005647994|nr:hypothetical protein [Amycolatopsis orientalis]